LLSRIDARGLRVPKDEEPEKPKPKPKPRPWCHWLNDALYTWRYPRELAGCGPGAGTLDVPVGLPN